MSDILKCSKKILFQNLIHNDKIQHLTCAGVVESLFIIPSYRGGGLGEELVNVAVSQCIQNRLRAVEMVMDSLEEGARKMCENQEWNMENMSLKNILGPIKIDQYRYRKPCSITVASK